ncbi:suppressor of fused domain protein [Chryseobacterium polytrichastri]|uniref:Suppressor of fused protein (SUFU) n=1 Tax=Chryseobacterium polytrichastri TaxID=1302687 RepID=A0A1M7KK30_9FLAO|nr:suppressor of fused domain protein [Chryseobacterium polytrichastri]SHM65632.1 Suppressor of fused protein (SUFU) [Chryseobacterium polytrichastri]
MRIVKHLEQYIGTISRATDIVDKKYNLTISVYDNIPFEEIRTYSTLGMNRYFIDYYYEFIFVCMAKYNENEIASFLTSFAEYLIDAENGVRRGDVLSFDFTMTSQTQMNSLYFTLPFYFDDNLQQLKLENKNVIFPLIIPIYNEEAQLIKEKGWNSFEEFLEENEVDNLLDLNRDKYFW